jgi:hypothetical protein
MPANAEKQQRWLMSCKYGTTVKAKSEAKHPDQKGRVSA